MIPLLLLSTSSAAELGVGAFDALRGDWVIDGPRVVAGARAEPVGLELAASVGLQPPSHLGDVVLDLGRPGLDTVHADSDRFALTALVDLAPVRAPGTTGIEPSVRGGVDLRCWTHAVRTMERDGPVDGPAVLRWGAGPVLGLGATARLGGASVRLSLLDRMLVSDRSLLVTGEPRTRLLHTPTVTLDALLTLDREVRP